MNYSPISLAQTKEYTFFAQTKPEQYDICVKIILNSQT
jgi:hypothetical protein